MEKKLVLLHSNDMHGDFLAEEIDKKLVGGVSRLAGYINAVRAQERNVLYTVAGDMFKGSVIDSEFKGISTIELMNMLSPDVVTLGNHEIDYGVAHLLFLEKCAKFPIVNANLFVKTNRARLFVPYTILEIDGLHIMFIGVITEEVLLQTKSDELVGAFIDVAEAAREIAVICDTYKTTQVDYTVLLTHIGFDKDQELAALIDNSWGVDLIIGGHTHTLLEAPCVVNGVPIVQAGCGTDQLGRFDLTFDTETRRLTDLQWRLIDINDDACPLDPVMEELLLHYKSHTDEKYGQILARFPRKLTHPARNQETELGNLFADILQTDSSFDLMILGSGSIRKTELGPVLRYQDLKEVMPYDDALYMLEVTGAELRHMLTFMLREEAFAGHTEFYQLSSGIRTSYSRSAGRFTRFEFRGREVEDGQIIKIALQDYHYKNFDAFFDLPLSGIEQRKKARKVATSIAGILEELFSSAPNEQLDAHVEGRIEVLP